MTEEHPDNPTPAREWIRNTLAAASGALAVVVTGVLAFGDVKRNASDALQACGDIRIIYSALEVRLRAAETSLATQHSELESLRTSLREVRDDVKELLRRVPPK